MHIRCLVVLLLITVLLYSPPSQAQVVVSQVYPGGGASGHYLNDYVELLNTANTSFTLTNHSLQYGSSSGNFGSVASNVYAFPSGTEIGPRSYLLIKCGPAGSGGIAVPGYDIDTANLSLGVMGGKVALVNQTTALNLGSTSTPLPLPDSRVLDLAAWGNSNNGEGGVAANYGVALNANQVAVRKNNGLQDNNHNGNDFDVLSAGGANEPRNSDSPPVENTSVNNWALY